MLQVLLVGLLRIGGCMAVAWIFYNPWLSVGGWLLDRMDAPEIGWLWTTIVMLGMSIAMVGAAAVVRNHLGWWAVALVVLLGLVAYIPFELQWLPITVKHVAYATWFFVLPMLVGCAMTSGFLIRWLNGTLPTTSVGGHVHATVDPTTLDNHHHQPQS